jgi:nitrate/nitrite-specific signal transduction histidine kinase
VSLISAAIIAVIAVNIIINNVKIQNIYEIEDNIVQVLTMQPANTADAALDSAMKDIARNHSDNMKTLADIINMNRLLLISLIAAIVAQSIILYVLLIRKTHRISGPIYVMSMYMKQVMEGQWPNPRPLRERDELKSFYELFGQMLNYLKGRGGQ